MIDISFKVTGGFDSAGINSVINKAEAANKKNLQKAGALLRLIARRSLRRRKKASSPGTPPSVHSKHPYANLKNVLYSLLGSDSLVVGPVLFRQPKNQDRLATNAQEFGGIIHRRRTVTKSRVKGYRHTKTGKAVRVSPAQAAAFKRKIKDGSIVRPASSPVTEAVFLPKRPTMATALKSASPKIPDLWKRTVTA